MNFQSSDRMQGISSFLVMELLQRAKQLESEGRDIIHMEIGEPDFPTPRAVVDAGSRFLQKGNVKYTPAAGLPDLRQAIADFYRQRYGISPDARRILVTPGASGALLLAFGISVNSGENIIMADPGYPCNGNFLRLFGAEAKFVPVGAESGYQLSAERIAENWQSGTRGVLIASPANPTGSLIGGERLKQIIEETDAQGGCLYADEIYHGLTYTKPAETALACSDSVFVVNSFSKYFGMTGWRIGWLVVPDAFIESVEKLAQNIFISAPAHSQYAALSAFLPENIGELECRRLEFKKRRDFLCDNLIALGFGVDYKPEGAFYVYANCSRFTEDSFQFAKNLLEVEGVAVAPGKDFGRFHADKHIRFAYTASIDRMTAALTRLEHFLCR